MADGATGIAVYTIGEQLAEAVRHHLGYDDRYEPGDLGPTPIDSDGDQ